MWLHIHASKRPPGVIQSFTSVGRLLYSDIRSTDTVLFSNSQEVLNIIKAWILNWKLENNNNYNNDDDDDDDEDDDDDDDNDDDDNNNK